MKRNIMILTVTAALLSSCGIYNRYTPTGTVPADLYGFNVERRMIPSAWATWTGRKYSPTLIYSCS